MIEKDVLKNRNKQASNICKTNKSKIKVAKKRKELSACLSKIQVMGEKSRGYYLSIERKVTMGEGKGIHIHTITH